jgi:site-specific recombinase XerD
MGERREYRSMPGLGDRSPRNKGQRYPADPPTLAEIVAVMRHAGGGLHAARRRALIVVLWRAGLRIDEALGEADLDPRRGSLLVRRGKGGRRREVGPGSSFSHGSPRASTFQSVRCCASRPARPAAAHGRPAPARTELRHAAAKAGVRRRFAPHQLRHAHAVEMAREGVPLIVIQRQLGHTNLGITSIYLQGIDSTEIIDTVHARRPPMVAVDATLRL